MACRYPPAGEILSSAGGDYTAAAESLLDYMVIISTGLRGLSTPPTVPAIGTRMKQP